MRRRYGAGFTLVELLVAVTIFAVLSAMAYGGLRSVITSEQAIAKQAKRLQALQQTMLFLNRDLAQLAPRGIRDEFGERQPPLRSQRDAPAAMELTRGGWSNPATQMRSTLQRVGYGLEGRELVRYSWRVLDRAPDSRPDSFSLLQGVKEWQWRFLDAEGAWHESWPPLGSEGASTTERVPKAVELKLVLEDMGTVRRLFEIASGSVVAGHGT